MSYTPTEWKNGDTITAEKMNNIENGVSNAVTGKMAMISLSAEGFSSASHQFGNFIYAVYNGEKWIVTIDDSADWLPVWGYAEPFYRVSPPVYVPDSETIGVFFAPVNENSVNITVTGDISETDTTVYFDYGSAISHKCHRIYGNGSIKLIAL